MEKDNELRKLRLRLGPPIAFIARKVDVSYHRIMKAETRIDEPLKYLNAYEVRELAKFYDYDLNEFMALLDKK